MPEVNIDATASLVVEEVGFEKYGTWALTGLSSGRRHHVTTYKTVHTLGYDCLHIAVDDRSRPA